MDHDEWLELISAEADGELDAPESERLAAHLQTCASCSALLGDFEAARRRARLRTTSEGDHLVSGVLAARDLERNDAATATATLIRRGGVALAGIAAAVAALAFLAPNASTPATPIASAPGGALIAAQNRSFDSANIEVESGTTVEWRNSGSTTHHLVRKLGGVVLDEDLPPGRTETATFEQPGVFEFYCAVHPEMTGTVTVDP